MKKYSTNTVNLVPKECVDQRHRAEWITRWMYSVVVTAFVIGIPGVYIGGSATLTDSGMSGQIEQANLEYAQNQLDIPVLRARLGKLENEREVLDLVRNRINWRDVFGVLVEAAGGEVRFRELSTTGGGIDGADPIQINIEGLAASQTAARAYVVGLEHSALFDLVELIETRREQIDEHELIGFRILITINGTGVTLGEGAGDE